MSNQKTLSIRVDSKFHTKIKLRAIALEMTQKDYVIKLIENDLKKG